MRDEDDVNPLTLAELLASIARWRENLLDAEIRVDDCRRTVDLDVEEFREAVRERDRIATHLQHLIDLHNNQSTTGTM